MRITAIIHGKSPRRHELQKRLEEVAHHYKDALLCMTTRFPGQAQEFAADAQDSDLIISCGGDGTHHQVLNGMLNGPQTPLAFIAAGSGNDFLRVHPKRSVHEIFQRLHSGHVQEIDVIRVRSGRSTSFALNVATCGIGAEIARTVNARKFRLPPSMNYYTAILEWLVRYKAPELKIIVDGMEMKRTSFLCAVGNSTYAGNGLGLNPQSGYDDGAMGLTIIGNVGVIDFLKYQSALKAAKEIQDFRVEYLKGREVLIEVASGSLPIETDGEFFDRVEAGSTCLFGILPRHIQVI